MNLFLICFTAGASILLSFLLFLNPLQQNVKANRWLGFFAFIIGCAFIGTYMLISGLKVSNPFLFKSLNSLQFFLAPSLFISILYFVNPTKIFKKKDWLHFIPFLIFISLDNIWQFGKESISTISIFDINKNVSFLIRDILPFITLFYVVKSYLVLSKHKSNLQLIASNINTINLDWLVQFLFILLLTVLIWINDALLEIPYLTEATAFIYASSVFFLAYFAIKQKTIFPFKEHDIKEIVAVIKIANDKIVVHDVTNVFETTNENQKQKRLNNEQIDAYSKQLLVLMEKEKLFLDNDLSLPTIAQKLGLSIHETSYLINETTENNFYNFINTYRIEEAKKLLTSAKIEELNILGIAFASGFNSKTTFNTTFKKLVGLSPSQYSKKHKI